MNITILGSGLFGISLAHLFHYNKNNITIWSKFDEEVNELSKKYLDYSFTNDMDKAIINSDIIILAVPIQFLDETLLTLKDFYHGQVILIASKGIHTTRLQFGYQMLENILPNIEYGVISGGTFAKDMMNECAMGMTLATTYSSVSTSVKNALGNDSYVKIQYSSDVIGVSICGAVKNVMAIGMGMFDGYVDSPSSRFLFLTEAILEIKKLIIKFNGYSDTILSYAGIDDIMMTCTSKESRNYTLGYMIGQQIDKKTIDDYKNTTTIEGLETLKAIYSMIKDYKSDFFIIDTIYQILYQNKSIHLVVDMLKNV